MSYIKKVVMHGFKSFPKKTELPFTPGINAILGPNGSGKSNVTDALCFVLGRLSIKSMRAAKASNLIFLGTKAAAPAKEASVEIVFDNSDKVFVVQEKEISIKRIVRKNGQSIYKINGATKTRQEVLALLAQAGIDPNGFNIVLQGEIQNFVRMQGEERRQVIEEVAGISIYESRKEKSLKELTKTEDRLKEVMAILRERTAYLNNLEKEREAALKHKKLEQDLKKLKKSVVNFDLTKKQKEKQGIESEITSKNKEIEKEKKIILAYKTTIESLEEKIREINSTIQKQTGLEQEKLNNEIANIRAELAGLKVKLDNNERKLSTIKNQKTDLENSIRENELSVRELQKESPTIERKEKELKIKKEELEKLEEKRKKFYMNKSELRSINHRIEDKKTILQNYENESRFLLKQIQSLTLELFDKKTDSGKVDELKLMLAQKKELLENLNKRERELEKLSHTNEYEIKSQNQLVEKISKMDICPVCKNNITKKHICSINDEAFPKINNLKKDLENADKELNEIYQKRDILSQDIEAITTEIQKRQSDLLNLMNIHEKKEQIKILQEKIDSAKRELEGLTRIKNNLEQNFDSSSGLEEKYETVKMEVEDISLRNKENLDSELSFKKREVERAQISLKQLIREEKDLVEELEIVQKDLKSRSGNLEKKRKEEELLTQKFQKFISKRDDHQARIRENESELSKKKNQVYNIEQSINTFKIDRARIDAEIENLEIEILEFPNAEIMKGNRENLTDRLRKTEETLSRIGSVNMRALEVYDQIKDEYESVKEKVDIITKEKESVLKIIHEIDVKKKKAFLTTLEELNRIFSRNFAQISTKGEVTLELQNRKAPFEGGVDIIVKTGHGKYFDVKSLSGGEQTMVALSLIFGIQELKPYAFYILDEIDAALDKRNSERLAGLLRKYMQQGQYIIITHNDEVITKATNLFGISMHDGVSKIISLKI
ncbi:chromosome segregation protein SMC [archaeon]|jgi:chromosome segregation protein|nr:chromosome segregation protein SMC [archaeon]